MTAKTKNNVKIVFLHLGGISLFAALMLVLVYFEIPFCPLKLIFKINCPFCGMTRAHLAAIQLDFGRAFSMHPLFPLGIPYLWLLFHERFFKSKGAKITRDVLIYTITAALIVTLIVRIFMFGPSF